MIIIIGLSGLYVKRAPSFLDNRNGERTRKGIQKMLLKKRFAKEIDREIREGAEHCNNVSSLRSFADKADALKLTEMDSLDGKPAREKAMEKPVVGRSSRGRIGDVFVDDSFSMRTRADGSK